MFESDENTVQIKYLYIQLNRNSDWMNLKIPCFWTLKYHEKLYAVENTRVPQEIVLFLQITEEHNFFLTFFLLIYLHSKPKHEDVSNLTTLFLTFPWTFKR